MNITDEMVRSAAVKLCEGRADRWHEDRTDDFPCSVCSTAALAAVVAAAPLIAAQALRSAAEEIRRELVCCDVYETLGPVLQARNLEGANEEVSDKNTGGHQICYWGDAAARIVEPLTADVEPDRCCARPNMVWEHSRAGKDHFRCVACGGGMTKARAT